MSSYVTPNPGYEVFTINVPESSWWLAEIRGPGGYKRDVPFVYEPSEDDAIERAFEFLQWILELSNSLRISPQAALDVIWAYQGWEPKYVRDADYL